MDEGTSAEADSTAAPPKEEESQCDRPSEVESCENGLSPSCENQDGSVDSCAPRTSGLEGERGSGSRAEKDERGKDADAQPGRQVGEADITHESLCDLSCGREAVVKIGKLNLCEVCVDSFPEIDIPGPRLRFEDVLMPDRPLADDEVL